MLALNPTTRPTMADILGHDWMRGEVSTREQFEEKCKPFLDEAIRDKLETAENYGNDHKVSQGNRRDVPSDFDPEVFLTFEFRSLQANPRAKTFLV